MHLGIVFIVALTLVVGTGVLLTLRNMFRRIERIQTQTLLHAEQQNEKFLSAMREMRQFMETQKRPSI
jgi:hypothetical protein